MPWYVAIAEPNAVVERPKAEGREGEPQTVMERLEELGAQVFWPKGRETVRRWCRQRRRYESRAEWVPLWGRYMLIGSDKLSGWAIEEIRGIARVVRNADSQPGTVSAETVERVRRECLNYRIVRQFADQPLKKGQMVRVIGGHFSGFHGAVSAVWEARGELTAMIGEAMGREVPLTLSVEDVEVV